MIIERKYLRGVSLRDTSIPRIYLRGEAGGAPISFEGYPLELDVPNARSMKNYTIFGNTSEDAKGVGDEVVRNTDNTYTYNGVAISAEALAHRLGYADAEHLPAFPYGSSFVAPIRVANPRGKVDLGSLTWTYQSTFFRFYSVESVDNIKAPASNADSADMSINGYTTMAIQPIDATNPNDMLCGVATNGRIYIRNLAFTDGASLKTALSGTMADFALTTPQTLATYPSVLSSPLHKIGDIVDYKESNGKEWHGLLQVDAGSLPWVMRSNNIFAAEGLDNMKGTRAIMMAGYEVADPMISISNPNYPDMSIKSNPTTEGVLYIRNSSCNSVAELIAALSGVPLVYELATPTEVQGEPLPRLAIPKGESIVTLDTAVEPSNITAKV